ncbi:MAG: bifunctional DNA-formamidopyrimidine glycosylase/DNA-(apurinic or apyrimidinic site) lyase [Thiothrix sp.]|nr:bifunctional DNA-formamidopyrimidine glycosylase/DNA-(apurinic or apyrimidinic site) lyase [Thiothrix sp.]HPQ94018.1 bifunctional DNA-formamidopyrimidine glycosylase/DNA-(apurinic or apyrimidinic site) lyase [Thiolinea sp.]
MPELPEVETTRRGVEPYLQGRLIRSVVVRQPRLRWPVPEQVRALAGCRVVSVGRRGKYLLFETRQGTVLVHLGMSGSLRISPVQTAPEKHDHVDFVLEAGRVLRLRDPRRFGAVLWSAAGEVHPLLQKLGVEPLEPAFDDRLLYQHSRGKCRDVKAFIMDSHVVVGIGNIYANEALFMAGIDPRTPAGDISLTRYQQLSQAIRTVLHRAIEQGGTTLRDFVREDGQSGYFQIALQVYGRTGEPCVKCSEPILQFRQGQRSSWYCPHCQR